MKTTVKNLLKKGGSVFAAVCMLCGSTFTVRADGDVTPDLTGQQWHFDEERNGVQIPDWNTADCENVGSAKKAVIAVVDSGIDYNHEDLNHVMWRLSESSASAKLTELGFGEYGIDTNDKDDDPMDISGHGTHVAGIIAAEWNGFGVSGALNGVRLMAVRANRNAATVYQGLQKVLAAKKAGVNIVAVNLSWNGRTLQSNPELLDGVITALGEAGVVTVMAAGNEDKNLDDEVVMSSFLRFNPYVIVVSASDQDGRLAHDDMGFSSNYGVRYCDVAAPGAAILSTFSMKSDEETTPDEKDIIIGKDGNRYAVMDGTSMATPIVTSLAALVYDRNSAVDDSGTVTVNLKADEIASRIIETAVSNDSFQNKVYGGLISPADAVSGNTAPLAYYGRVKSGALTIWGTDFGSKRGTVTVDGTAAAVTGWTSGSITVSAGTLAMGDHNVVITRADQKFSSKWISVSGSSDRITELSTEGLEETAMERMVTTGGVLYVYGKDMRNEQGRPVLFSRASDASSWKPIPGFEEFPSDLDAAGGRLYLLSSLTGHGIITVYNPSSRTAEQTITLDAGAESNWKIRYVDERIYMVRASYDSGQTAAHIAYVNKDGSLTKTAVIEGVNSVLDFFQYDGEKYLIAEGGDYVNEAIVVYRINESSGTGTKVFDKKYKASDSPLKAFGFQDRLIIAPIVTKNEEGSYSFAMEEYEYSSGKLLQSLPLGGGHLQSQVGTGYEFTGAIFEGMFYTAFLADSLRHNTGVLRIPLNGYTPPTPVPTGTPEPASKSEGSSPASSLTPSSAVQTCQDAGFAEGWYWDETKKACVAPQGRVDGEKKSEYSGTADPGRIPGSGGDQETGRTDTTTGDTEGSSQTDASAEPETDAAPESDVTPSPSDEPDSLPIDIINPTSLMWFLGIPVVMIIAGLAVYLLKNTGLIPWIIGADAILAILLAVLDHSVVGWILLVLNLAAVGLLALYRLREKEEE